MALEAADSSIDNANCMPGFIFTDEAAAFGHLQDNLMGYIY